MHPSAARRSPLPAGLKRKAVSQVPTLNQCSTHAETLEWLQSFLDNESYSDAVAQMKAANAGRPDGEVLLDLSDREVQKAARIG